VAVAQEEAKQQPAAGEKPLSEKEQKKQNTKHEKEKKKQERLAQR
jgi:hypothetical protein